MNVLLKLAFTWALAAEAWVPQPPLGLDLYMPVPDSNPLTRQKVGLGRRLFFDKRLSRDGTLACSSCHDPRLAFSDGRSVARGINGAEGARNAPALINRGFGRSFFWDGRADSLERQALQPILNPIELGLRLRSPPPNAKIVSNPIGSETQPIHRGRIRVPRPTPS